MQIEEEVRPWQITNSSTLYMFFYSSPFHISFHEGLSGFTKLPNVVYFMPKICLTNSCREPFCSGFEPKNVQQNFISLYLMNFAHCQFIFFDSA